MAFYYLRATESGLAQSDFYSDIKEHLPLEHARVVAMIHHLHVLQCLPYWSGTTELLLSKQGCKQSSQH